MSSAFANTYGTGQGGRPCRANVTPEGRDCRSEGRSADSSSTKQRVTALPRASGEGGHQRQAGGGSLNEAALDLGLDG